MLFRSNVIDDVRQQYSGDLTYAVFNDVSQVSFWNQLNVIGVDAYYGLTSNTNPSYSDVLAGWTSNTVPSTQTELGITSSGPINVVAELQALSSQYGEPVYFSEFGGQSFQGVVNNPGGAGPKVADGGQQQEWLYQSMFQALSQDNASGWFQGVNMWAAYPQDTPESSPLFASFLQQHAADFLILGKPAGLVVASWFGAKDYFSSANQSSFTGSIANDQIALYGGNIAASASTTTATRLQTFPTTISVTLDGTIINGQTPTVHFYVNGIDEGAQTLQNIHLTGTYVDSNGIPWTTQQTFTFTLPGLTNISQLKVAIDSPYNVGGVENAQTYISSVSVDGVALTQATYFPLVG